MALPEAWSEQDVQAVLRLREFFQQLATAGPGGYAGAARLLGYKRAASLDQLCDGRQKVGVSILERIHAAGYSAVAIYPQHAFAQSLSNSNSTRRLYLVPLNDRSIAERVVQRKFEGLESKKLAVVVGQSDIPAAAFLVLVPDDRLAQEGIERGALLVCDPHIETPAGTRPRIIVTDDGLDIVSSKTVKKTAEAHKVFAVAVLKTMEAVSLT